MLFSDYFKLYLSLQTFFNPVSSDLFIKILQYESYYS